ncbi:hypothetical protein ACS127_17260 [Amphibacillus sp. Q70]|uniref:hypothetical protein n=1 Tax=Amphibacillus sp. Q70 TaxID=3453416 RepID=UPI003F8572EB
MAMTPFEKALLGELKSIRKELQKMNQNGPFDIKIEPPVSPPSASDILADKLAELKESQEKKTHEETEEKIYDPLSRG